MVRFADKTINYQEKDGLLIHVDTEELAKQTIGKVDMLCLGEAIQQYMEDWVESPTPYTMWGYVSDFGEIVRFDTHPLQWKEERVYLRFK